MVRNPLKSIFLVSLLLGTPGYAENFDGLIAQIKTSNPNSSVFKLSQDEASPYFAIKTLTTLSPSKGTIILIHDQGEHADWPDVIQPLRKHLLRAGWNTLSAQFPQIAPSAEPTDSATPTATQAYVNELIRHLTPDKVGSIVLLSHGENTHYLTTALSAPLDNLLAYVAISASDPLAIKIETSTLSANLLKLNVPILDLYAQRDYPHVIQAANVRLQRIKEQTKTNTNSNDPNTPKSNLKYQQVVIPVAEHSFRGQEEVLSKRIAGWLAQNAKHIPTQPKPQ